MDSKRSMSGSFFAGIIVLFFLFPAVSSAATLVLDPQSGTYGPGDTFLMTVRVDPGTDECINAVSVEVDYPYDMLRASAVSKGESLLTLWPEEPTIDLAKGVVRFNGGIPAGYCGRVQGDPGKTNIIAKIVFTVPGAATGTKSAIGASIPVTFGPETQVLLNDGFGTRAPLVAHGAVLTRGALSIGKGDNEWLDLVHQDKMPPDLFNISLEHDANTYQGKYFIVFSTVDKQSGVHHYEVTEDDPDHPGFVRGKRNEHAVPVVATSPYVLRDQTLASRVIVRAYDHAGNTEEARLAPKGASAIMLAQTKDQGKGSMWQYVLTAIGAIVLSALVVYFSRRHKEETIEPVE